MNREKEVSENGERTWEMPGDLETAHRFFLDLAAQVKAGRVLAVHVAQISIADDGPDPDPDMRQFKVCNWSVDGDAGDQAWRQLGALLKEASAPDSECSEPSSNALFESEVQQLWRDDPGCARVLDLAAKMNAADGYIDKASRAFQATSLPILAAWHSYAAQKLHLANWQPTCLTHAPLSKQAFLIGVAVGRTYGFATQYVEIRRAEQQTKN